MRIETSQQNFYGKIHVIGEIGSKQKEALTKSLPQLEEVIHSQDFDLFIKRTSFDEIIVGTDMSCGYIVNYNNNFLRSALLAIKDKTNGSYMQRKINAIKEAMSEREII